MVSYWSYIFVIRSYAKAFEQAKQYIEESYPQLIGIYYKT